MNPESLFSRWLCSTILVRGHVQRIENIVGSGVPDINYCCYNKEIWIETKIGHPKLRPFQWAWMQRRTVNGGRVFIISSEPDSGEIMLWNMFNIVVELRGQYLEPVNEPDLVVDKCDKDRVYIVHNFILK